jgi:hypothetical protein
MIGAGLRLTRAATPAASTSPASVNTSWPRPNPVPPASAAGGPAGRTASRARLRISTWDWRRGADGTGLGRTRVGRRAGWAGVKIFSRTGGASGRAARTLGVIEVDSFTESLGPACRGTRGVGAGAARRVDGTAGGSAATTGLVIESVIGDSAAASATRPSCAGAAAAGCEAVGAAGSERLTGFSTVGATGAAVGGAAAAGSAGDGGTGSERGAGKGWGTSAGSKPSGSTYPSGSAAIRTPRWTCGADVTASTLAPTTPTTAPSVTTLPLETLVEPS